MGFWPRSKKDLLCLDCMLALLRKKAQLNGLLTVDGLQGMLEGETTMGLLWSFYLYGRLLAAAFGLRPVAT